MSATLQAFLRSSCRGLGVEPRFLDDPAAAADPLTALLQEAIALREEHRAELSLQVLEMARSAGLNSDWLDDNRARALLALERHEEAELLLHELCQSSTEAIAESAREQLETMRRGPADGQERIQVLAMPEAHTETEEATADDTALIALLERAITLREQGLAEASLALLNDALTSGQSSPWLDDNRARALVNLGRRFEAEAIWRSLVNHADAAAAETATAMANQLRAAVLETLLQAARAAAAEHNWALRSLDSALASLEDAEQAVLQEAIATRDSGHASLSLALVEAALELGFPSPWLQDNRARALVNLGRRQEAAQLWTALEQSGDAGLAAMAGPLAREQESLLIADLQQQLSRVAAEHGIRLEALREPGSSVSQLEHAVLQDAIAARDQGHAAASLALLQAAVQAGLQSGWLLDNQARALVHQQKPVQAVALWRQLQQQPDQEPALQQAAAEMLELYGREADRLATITEADALLDRDQPDAAITLLSEAILADPRWDGWQEALKRAVSRQAEPAPTNAGLLEQELREPRLALQAFDAFLKAVEARLAGQP